MIALNHKPAGNDGNMEMRRMMSFSRLSVFVFVVFWMLSGCSQTPATPDDQQDAPSADTAGEQQAKEDAPIVHGNEQPAAKSADAAGSHDDSDGAAKPGMGNDSAALPPVQAVENNSEEVPAQASDNPPPEPAEDSAQAGVPEEAQNEHKIDSLDELSESQKQKLSAIVWDVDPEVLNAIEQKNEGGHFPFSDEKHLDLFKDSIENLGGVYAGVGTDQGYLFVGWQRPTLAFMIDYDPWVIVIHRMYMAFWLACEDSACLHHYFDDRDAGLAFLESEAGVAAQLNTKAVNKIYRTTQRSIARQLKRLEKMPVKTFMNDAESFNYIRNLIRQERLRTFQANLLGDRAFASLASTLRELGASVTTLYLSNAEQYWGYSEQFKKNIIELPASDNALILRTSATYPINTDYRYSIQPMKVFKAWLSHPEGKTVRQVTKRVRVKGPDDFPFVVDDFMPPEVVEN